MQIHADPRVAQAYCERSNFEYGKLDYWIHLKEGYISPSSNSQKTIHERTIGRCCDFLNNDVISEIKIK